MLQPMRGAMPVLLVLGSSCSEVVFVPMPETADARSMIFTQVNGDALRIIATDLPPPGGGLVLGTDELEDGASFHAVLYPCPLSAHAVEPGVQSVVAAPAGAPIPEGSVELIRTSLETEWSSTDARPDALADVRIDFDPKSRCPRYTLEQILIDSSTSVPVTDATRLDGDRILLVSADGPAWVLDGFNVQPVEIPELVTGVFFSGEEVFFVTLRGEVQAGPLGGPYRDLPPLGITPVPQVRLSGSMAPDPYPLFAVVPYEAALRFDGTAWETLTTYTGSETGVVVQPSAQLSRDELVAISVTDDRDVAFRYAAGRITEEPLPGIPSAARFIPGVGATIGVELGEVLNFSDGRWQTHPVASTIGSVRVLAPFENGLLFGGNRSEITPYSPDVGLCPPVSTALRKVNRLIPVGDDYVSISVNSDSAVRLNRLNPRPLCR